MKNRLKALRLDRGWTQGALADRLGVSRQTVNALETGRYDPALPLAFRIAHLFDQQLESIFLPTDVLPTDDVPTDDVPTDDVPPVHGEVRK